MSNNNNNKNNYRGKRRNEIKTRMLITLFNSFDSLTRATVAAADAAAVVLDDVGVVAGQLSVIAIKGF